MSSSEWSVQIPLTDLAALMALPKLVEDLQQENKQLRREVEGLQRINSDFLQKFRDLDQQVKSL